MLAGVVIINFSNYLNNAALLGRFQHSSVLRPQLRVWMNPPSCSSDFWTRFIVYLAQESYDGLMRVTMWPPLCRWAYAIFRR